MSSSPTEAEADYRLIEALLPSVITAGKVILNIRERGHVVETKPDFSPVTEADRSAEAIILGALAKHAPEIPIVAEEEVAAGRIPEVDATFFAVDALDGTRDFIRGGSDFTVNVGLVRDGRAVAGIIGAPALSQLWIGTVGLGARRLSIEDDGSTDEPIQVRKPAEDGLDIVASRHHRTPETDDFIARFPDSRVVAAGSSLKLVTIAEGKADLYPRLGPTSQWDIAAGDAVLTAAGGSVLDMDGQPLAYGPRASHVPHPFLNPWFVATGGIDPFSSA